MSKYVVLNKDTGCVENIITAEKEIEIKDKVLLKTQKWISKGDIYNFNTQEFTNKAEPKKTAEQIARELISTAILLLEMTDKVALRCFKSGVTYNQEWLDYRNALVDVVNGVRDTLPIQPINYPEGS